MSQLDLVITLLDQSSVTNGRKTLTFEKGVKLLEKCMRVLLYCDRSAINKLQIAKITEEDVTIYQPYALKTFWEFGAFQNPTVGARGSW